MQVFVDQWIFPQTSENNRVDTGRTHKAVSGLFFEVTIHTLPHLKCMTMVSERSGRLPFKMHQVGFRAFKSPLY